jgi:adenine phosphoribosyltransferase
VRADQAAPQAKSADITADLRRAVRDVPDFPKPGIIFKDITPVLADAELFARTVDALAAPFGRDGITHVAGIESRGFIFGAPVSHALGAGFLPIRKRGKLPYQTRAVEYALEYGTDSLEMHIDACAPHARVLVVDDVLATGGTAAAACRLVEEVGGTVVGCAFVIALSFLPGLETLRSRRAHVLITY